MSSQQKHRIQVPDGLRDVLLEFSIAYLLEQPGDVIDYAVEFFSKLQENRKTTMITAAEPISPDESIMSHEEGEWSKIDRYSYSEELQFNLFYSSRFTYLVMMQSMIFNFYQ